LACSGGLWGGKRMADISGKPTVLIIGAGPAGSSAALRLAMSGLRPVLIDKATFPRDKVCGDGIPQKVLHLLPQLGLNPDEVKDLGFPIFGMEFYGPQGQRLALGAEASRSAAKSFCIPRKIFDYFLFRAAAARAGDVLSGFKAVHLERRGQQWELFLRDVKTGKERRLTADIILAADGATSLLVRKALHLSISSDRFYYGLRQYFSGGPFPETVRIIYDARLLPGYAWLFPVSRTRANVGIMVQRNALQAKQGLPLQSLFDQIIHENDAMRRLLGQAQAEERYGGALLPLGSVPGKRVSDGFLAIGDAAAFVNPLSGGGIYYAMQSGLLAAEAIIRAIGKGDWSARGLHAYEAEWRKRFLPGFKVADGMRRWLSSPRKTRHLFDGLKKRGSLAALFVRVYGQPLPRFFYLRPAFWLSVRAARFALKK